MLLTWCWFSGGEMTGKFRKVASHPMHRSQPLGCSTFSAMGRLPLEPPGINGVAILKCPPDIPTEDLLIGLGRCLTCQRGIFPYGIPC